MKKYLKITTSTLVVGLLALAVANHVSGYFEDQDWRVSRTHPITVWNPVDGSLDTDQRSTWTLPLRAGQQYKIFGVCDQDCEDLDLYLYDQLGNLVVKDTSPNSTPALTITPRYTENYKLEVSMYSCSYEPCDYMVGFRRR